MEAWVLHLARIEADKAMIVMKKDVIKESVQGAVKASTKHMEELERIKVS